MAASKQLQRLKPWHYRLIDWMLANPTVPQHKCAKHFNVSPVWMSLIVNSPIFITEFQRRSERLSHAVATDVAGAATKLANLALDTAMEKLEHERDTMPIGEIWDCVAMSMHYLGYPKPQPIKQPRPVYQVRVK